MLVPGPKREVVCAVKAGADGARASRLERIVSAAARLASGCSAPLRLVTVREGGVDDLAAASGSYATDVLALSHPDLPVTAQTLLGDPVELITRTSGDSGLLVVGAPHESGVAAVLGGTPVHRIIHDATCPVMLVH